ncbi:hypothetical protein [Daejeonella sp. JGW-45]|uniref:hypothetical protein n=1 Tax=Daejeonella sp. JGW-45 TaxID=3034148 RepID=UPI0023EC725C|nr:hypothetical protein [Daejeonella sp. JGW-45]
MKVNLLRATMLLLILLSDLGGICIAAHPDLNSKTALFPDVAKDTLQVNSGTLVNLGPQITMTTVQSGVFLKDQNGNDLLYTVVRGLPAHLAGYDLKSNNLVADIPLDNMDGAWGATVSTDGTFYAGGGGGHLYSYTPGASSAQDLGLPLGTETYIWDLLPGADGEIFGASYPGCRVFRYHPKEGFTDVGKGPIVPGENYVRSIALNQTTGKIYAGIGSHARLVELDIASGKKREMLPEKYHNQAFVYDLKLVKDVAGGDRLLATVTDIGKTLTYNLTTGVIEKEQDKIGVRSAIKSPSGNKLFYGDDVSYFSADLAAPGESPQMLGRSAGILASHWISPDVLYLFNRRGQLIKYDSARNISSSVFLKIPPQPISINAVSMGPDGRVWTGGYLSGSNAAYDPATGKTVEYRGISQTEGVTLHGPVMYFGIYPHGRLYRYDTAKPWSTENNNPKMIAKIPEQSRFFAGTALPEQNKVFFGSVPEYGLLGGSLVEYNVLTEKIETFNDVVPKLSIVSLVNSGGYVFGGTSVWGGLGVQPDKNEASLFVWDPVQKKKTFEIIPVENAKAITFLMNGPDGNIWGVADGILFIFNPATQQVLSRHLVYEVSEERKKRNIWHDVSMVIHPSGDIYGTGGGKFFKINPNTKSVTTILSPASKLTMEKNGTFYFSRGKDLWQYKINK